MLKSSRSDVPLILGGRDGVDVEGQIRRAWESGRPFALASATGSIDESILQCAANHLQDVGDDAFGVLTSGTTGTPKFVIGHRSRALGLAQVIGAAQNLDAAKDVLVTLPLTYSFSFINQWVWSYVCGSRPHIVRGGVAGLSDAIRSSKSAFVCLVGAQVPALLRGVAEPCDEVVRLCFAGGPFPSEAYARLREVFPRSRIFNNYGCTEAMPRLTVNEAVGPIASNDIGFPLPGVEFCQASNDDELLFKSKYAALGYAAANGLSLWAAEDWIRTGDRAELASNGSWRLLGRTDDVFKRYGEKIALGALRADLTAELGVRVELLRARDRRNEPGYRLLLREPDESTVGKLKDYLRTQYSRAFWPISIEQVGEWSLSRHGKVDVAATARSSAIIWRNG